MLRNDPTYRRIKAGGSGPFGSASYWLGTDHLLVVALNGYVENYRRFLFSDIQGLILRKTRTQLLLGLVFGGLALLCLVGGLRVWAGQSVDALSTDARIGLGVLLGLGLVFGGLVLANWLRGPSCVCYLRTAVQTTVLPQVSRWPQAQRLGAELTPRVLAAQEERRAHG